MNISSSLFPPNCQSHVRFTSLLHTITTFLPKKSTTPQAFIHHQPLNLNHPILSKLEKCKNIFQFNQIHGSIITVGLSRNVFAISRLIFVSSFSLNPPNIPLACQIFSQIQEPDVYTYNIIIKAYSKDPNSLNSFTFYQKMLLQGLQPNEYTFCFLFTSSANLLALKMGKQIHPHFIKCGFNNGVFGTTSLLHMYSECGDLSSAIQMFGEMHQRTNVSWGAMIDAYISHGYSINGIRLFLEMRKINVEASNATLVKVLCACGKEQILVLGRTIHSYIVIQGFELNVTLGTSLVDMYSKCGSIDIAMCVFSRMLVKSVESWNCMINGLAVNGRAEEAIKLFEEMVSLDESPNGATFLGLLQSCTHRGLVREGLKYFSKMSEVYGIIANVKHYGCVVDLYGRAGLIEEALEVIRKMHVKPDIVIWGALLCACKMHGYSRLGEVVVGQVIKLVEPDRITISGLSDMYAMSERWEDVVEVRKRMREKFSLQRLGFSYISS